MKWFEGRVHCRGWKPKDTPMTEQISHFCSITSCILLVKAPLNHLLLLLPLLHPHHYKRYMGAAFASQLLIVEVWSHSLQAFSIWDCHVCRSRWGSLWFQHQLLQCLNDLDCSSFGLQWGTAGPPWGSLPAWWISGLWCLPAIAAQNEGIESENSCPELLSEYFQMIPGTHLHAPAPSSTL